VTIPEGKSIGDLVFTLLFDGTIGQEELAVAGRRSKAYPTPWIWRSSCNRTFPTTITHRLVASVSGISQGSPDVAGGIRHKGGHNPDESAAGAKPALILRAMSLSTIAPGNEITLFSYDAVRTWLDSGGPQPLSGHWYGNYLDKAISSASDYLSGWKNPPMFGGR